MVELFGIEEVNKSFSRRYWRDIRLFLLIWIIMSIGVWANFSRESILTVAIFAGVFLFLILLWGLAKTVNILYKVHLDQVNDKIEIETLHYSTVKRITKDRKDVKIKVIQNGFAKYIEDMIRIDVNRRTFFTQKQEGPWTRDKIEQVKNMVDQKGDFKNDGRITDMQVS